MNKQQAPRTTSRKPQASTDSSQISPADTPQARNGMPPGTVASRVQFLQSLQTSSTPWSGSDSDPTPGATHHRRESSRCGFGRRLTNRFGPPALQSAQPYEESQVDTSHSFLGLNTPRLSHMEEHGHADIRIRYSKSPGINGAVAPVQKRTQYDTVVPWTGWSRSKSARSMGRRQKGNDMDGHTSGMADYGQFSVKDTKLSFSGREDDLHSFHQDYKLNEANIVNSENSLATTSTTRRESVRELFDEYGIERPESLVSSIESSHNNERNSQPTQPHRFCHLCSWVNSGPSDKCWRCNHQLCSVCDAQSPQSIPRKEAGLGYSGTLKKSKTLQSQRSHVLSSEIRRASETEPFEYVSSRPGPTPIQKRVKRKILPPREGFGPPIKFPDLYPEFSPAAKSEQAPHAPTSPSNAVNGPTRKKPAALFPLDPQAGSRRSLPNDRDHRFRHQYQHSSSSVRCGEHRRTTLCTKVQGERRLYDESETGYVEDTSRAEDEFRGHLAHQVQPSESSIQTQSTFTRPQSHDLQNAILSHKYQKEVKGDNYVAEFVECRGYPRTGHIHHGTCSGTELVGECQHCLEDCECAACQNTHHDVRSCTHQDHKAMVHQHHTPRRETSAPFPHSRPILTPCTTFIPPSPVTATRGHPRSPDTQLPTTNGSEQNGSSRQVLSPRPSIQKVPSILTPKKATFIKEAPKLPIPPPWVAVRRSSLLRPLQQEPAESPKKQAMAHRFASHRDAVRAPTTKICSQAVQYNDDYDDKNGVLDDDQATDSVPSKRQSMLKEKGTSSAKYTARSSSPHKISPPGAGKASSSRKDLVPLLTQNLLQDQWEGRPPQETRHKHVDDVPPGGVASLARALEEKGWMPEQESKKPRPRMLKSMMAGKTGSMDSIKKSVDKQPSSPCMNDCQKTFSKPKL